jgi:RNA polymerase sigma-70 factor (ECF subfamily)
MAASPLIQVILQEVSDPVDRELLEMILTGERKTAPYARSLGIADRSETEQRKIVKRHKDRLKKRLRRLGVRLREQTTQ